MCRVFILIATLILGFSLTSQRALAFDVVPTVSVIDLPEAASGVIVTVRNHKKVELPVAMEIFERFVNEDGSERYEEADNLFVIFPPQAVIPPGGSQALRVQWVDAPPKTSRSFTLFASEIPVDLEGKEGPLVQTVFRMGASVHVAPAGTKPKPVLQATVPDEDGVSVTLGNEGDRFYYIDTLALQFKDKRIEGLDLGAVAGRTLVPPGGRRTFKVSDVSGTPTLEAK